MAASIFYNFEVIVQFDSTKLSTYLILVTGAFIYRGYEISSFFAVDNVLFQTSLGLRVQRLLQSSPYVLECVLCINLMSDPLYILFHKTVPICVV